MASQPAQWWKRYWTSNWTKPWAPGPRSSHARRGECRQIRQAVSKKEALFLRGKLAFCDAFILGRIGKLALQYITKHAYANPFVAWLESLMLLKSRLLAGKPRILTCKMLDTFFVFTDASFSKEEGGGFGAFLAAQDGRILSWFSLHVDAARFAAWFEQGRQNLIGEFETLTVALALKLWGKCVASSQVMIYIDKWRCQVYLD